MNNPWTFENWNLTEQGRVYTERGIVAAQKLAAEAGTTLGGPKPKPPNEVKIIERHWIIQKKIGGGSSTGLIGAGSSGSGPPS